jgi:hypothetical protein
MHLRLSHLPHRRSLRLQSDGRTSLPPPVLSLLIPVRIDHCTTRSEPPPSSRRERQDGPRSPLRRQGDPEGRPSGTQLCRQASWSQASRGEPSNRPFEEDTNDESRLFKRSFSLTSNGPLRMGF